MKGRECPYQSRFGRITPRSRAATNLLLAALVWTAVGTGLASAGLVWLFSGTSATSTAVALALLAIGAVLGGLKYRFAISKTGKRAAARIVARGDGKCVGGVFSAATWLFILGMMLLGNILRRLPIPLWLLGVIYLAVGVALFAGSFIYWVEWRRVRSQQG